MTIWYFPQMDQNCGHNLTCHLYCHPIWEGHQVGPKRKERKQMMSQRNLLLLLLLLVSKLWSKGTKSLWGAQGVVFWVITWEHAMVSKLHIGKFQQGETRYIFFHLLCVSDTCFWYMLFVWCHVLQLQTNTTVEQPQRGKEKQAASKKSVPRKKNVPSKEVGGHLVTTLNHHLLQTMSTLSQKL